MDPYPLPPHVELTILCFPLDIDGHGQVRNSVCRSRCSNVLHGRRDGSNRCCLHSSRSDRYLAAANCRREQHRALSELEGECSTRTESQREGEAYWRRGRQARGTSSGFEASDVIRSPQSMFLHQSLLNDTVTISIHCCSFSSSLHLVQWNLYTLNFYNHPVSVLINDVGFHYPDQPLQQALGHIVSGLNFLE